MTVRLILILICLMPFSVRGAESPNPEDESPERMLQRAGQLVDDGRAAAAIKLYEGFLKKYPGHSQVLDAHYRLAKCMDSIGWVDEAIPHLEQVVDSPNKQYRQRVDAFYTLGKLHGSLKQYEAAVKVFEKMIGEGAGLYEDEVMSLCAGYYAVLKKHDDAAAKLNLLLRKKDAKLPTGQPLAEQAAYKLVLLWLDAEKMDNAVDALGQLSQEFPGNKQVPGLMVQIADLCRRQKKYREATNVCEQLKARFPKTLEALAGSYVLGQCYRDRKEYQKAASVFEEIARSPEHRRQGLAAEALVQSAEIHQFDLADPDKAMARYEEAATLARDSDSERKTKILEQCYFHLAEYHFQRKKWTTALEYYLLLRKVGTELNILGRIMRCEAELNSTSYASVGTESDLAAIRKKIEQSPGTFAAAEGEVFLIDRKLAGATRRRADLVPLAGEYAQVLAKYPKGVLAQSSLASYVYTQIGYCRAQGPTPESWKKGIEAYEKSIEVDPATLYKIPSLESIAVLADKVGDKQKAFETYKKLYELAEKEGGASGTKDPKREQQSVDYLKGMLSRAAETDSITSCIEMVERIKAEKGVFSDAAREAQFYLGELYFAKKDFSAAAKAFQHYIRTYGPKQGAPAGGQALGDVEGAPWKPAALDAKTDQVYEAAVRIANAWYLQGHTQNMLEAYRWILRNIPGQNPYVAEAQYWLTQELGTGKKGQTREGLRELAEALWRNVVNPSFNFADSKLSGQFHFWVGEKNARYAGAQQYVKSAILKCAKILGEQGEHELAARVLEQYLALYQLPKTRPGADARREETYDIAHYALGREYIALGEIGKLTPLFEPYTYSGRDDRFRASGLKLLGYHAGKDERYKVAVLAYATLLDEYGENRVDKDGVPIPVPQTERLRAVPYNWNGVRMKPPDGLDLGGVRFALGFLYWKMEDWGQCVKALVPLFEDAKFRTNESRAKALYMAGQSYYRMYDYASGVKVIDRLIREHPRFEAIHEAYVNAARGYVETQQWPQLEQLEKTFVSEQHDVESRPRMDLYAALGKIGQGGEGVRAGVQQLRSICESETFEDVKADAAYYVAMHLLKSSPPDEKEAQKYFEKSIKLYPRETSCLEAAKLHIRLEQWESARELLGRVLREFPAGDARKIGEAKELLTLVLKQLAKKNQEKGT